MIRLFFMFGALGVIAYRTVFVLAVVFVLAFVLGAVPARSHWLYSMECCDERDCRPAKPGEVERTATGYIVRIDGVVVETIPDTSPKLKFSPDGQYHLCTYMTFSPYEGEKVIIRCLYRMLEGY